MLNINDESDIKCDKGYGVIITPEMLSLSPETYYSKFSEETNVELILLIVLQILNYKGFVAWADENIQSRIEIAMMCKDDINIPVLYFEDENDAILFRLTF